MTARITLTHHEGDQRAARIAERAGELRSRLRELAEIELRAYEPVLVAMRLPTGDPDRSRQLDVALSRAAESPLEIARAGAELADLALELAGQASTQVRGDAVAGAHLAEGACRAAAELVAVNLARRPDDPRRAQASRLARRARGDASMADRGSSER